MTAPPARKHSSAGLISLALGCASTLATATLFVAATLIPQHARDRSTMEHWQLMIGLAAFLIIAVTLLSVAMGVIGLMQKQRQPTSAVLGLLSSGASMMSLVLGILIGLSLG